MNLEKFDVIIIGSGVAGLSLALRLSKHCEIAVLTKSDAEESATWYAQGGIAAVLGAKDTIASHVADTLNAGAGLCDPKVVQFVVQRGPDCINWLIEQGVSFTRDRKESFYHLTREGGHTCRRVIHADDATGREVEKTLLDSVRNNPNIKLFDHYFVIDLIVRNKHCAGVYAYDERQSKVKLLASKTTVLATGGASRVYLYTTNQAVASGDGIALGWRAGCRIRNMEFNQFHPTCLYHPAAGPFLITEAMRGEGAILRLPDGKRFMPEFDSRAELAPRDIVARAIDHEMKRLGLRHVLLDISHKPTKFIKQHFPTIYQKCLEFGFDLTLGPIPVVPAAHYTCGGIKVDLKGRTDIPNLYAIGEVSCTGLHGANRLASNSLLECLVYAESASRDILINLPNWVFYDDFKPWDESWVTDSNEEVFVLHNWEEIRRFMWDYVGIVRSNKRLQRAADRISLLKREIQEYYGNFRINKNLLELRNLILVAELIVKSAVQRKESRGLHYTLDYSKLKPKALNTTLCRKFPHR